MPASRKPAAKRSSPRSARNGNEQHVTVENVNAPGYEHRVDAPKYTAMRRALLKILPAKEPGLTQAEMFRAVRAHLPEALFPGGAKVNWWAKTVQLDLDAKRIVVRRATAPLRWIRAAG